MALAKRPAKNPTSIRVKLGFRFAAFSLLVGLGSASAWAQHPLHPPTFPKPLPPIPGELRSPEFRVPVPFKDAYRDGYVFVLWGQDYDDAQIQGMLKQIALAGSKHVTIPLFGCQSDLTSSDVGSCTTGGPRAYTLNVARLAKQEGLIVSLLPIVITRNWEWRGAFEPQDVDGWFRNYTAWIRGVAIDARSLGMQELVVGTEFSRLYRYESRWRDVLREVRKDFAGPLILTVNWGDLNHQFWDAVDAIGISSYYPLSNRNDPDQAELDRAWLKIKREMISVARTWERPLHLTEVGYPSVPGAAREPWLVPTSGVSPDPDLQARCFAAFTKAWKGDKALVRANIWATTDPNDSTHPLSFDPLGKPAQTVLGDFFRLRGATRILSLWPSGGLFGLR